MGKIVANAAELRNAISVVTESVGNAESTFVAVENRLHDALSRARTVSERARIVHELEIFQHKAQVAIKQIRTNAQRTISAFSQRLSLVAEKRG